MFYNQLFYHSNKASCKIQVKNQIQIRQFDGIQIIHIQAVLVKVNVYCGRNYQSIENKDKRIFVMFSMASLTAEINWI